MIMKILHLLMYRQMDEQNVVVDTMEEVVDSVIGAVVIGTAITNAATAAAIMVVMEDTVDVEVIRAGLDWLS